MKLHFFLVFVSLLMSVSTEAMSKSCVFHHEGMASVAGCEQSGPVRRERYLAKDIDTHYGKLSFAFDELYSLECRLFPAVTHQRSEPRKYDRGRFIPAIRPDNSKLASEQFEPVARFHSLHSRFTQKQMIETGANANLEEW